MAPDPLKTERRARDGSRRGGARPNSGPKKKELRSPTAVTGIDLAAAYAAPPPAEIDGALRGRAKRSLDGLVKVMLYAGSDPARIAAAEEILDRGYGKPAVEIGGDAETPLLPFGMAPSLTPSMIGEVRLEARDHANAAIAVLIKIADNSLSETARVAAHRALIKRECGTVGTARMPDEMREKPLGKKEQAQRAAQAAATGRYATPPPPRQLGKTDA